MNELFAETAESMKNILIPEATVVQNNRYFAKWLGPLFVGLYTAFASEPVFTGEVSLGKFLATISIFGELSNNFGEVCGCIMIITSVFDPLKAVTQVLNLATDVPTWKTVNRKRRAMTRAARGVALSQMSGARPPGADFLPAVDIVPFTFTNVGFRYEHGPP